MTREDGAIWLFGAIAFVIGWWWRGRAERKRHADSRPAWMGRLGHALAGQFYDVDQTHRFTGDDVEVSNVQTYEGGGHRFVVTVKRKRSVTIDA